MVLLISVVANTTIPHSLPRSSLHGHYTTSETRVGGSGGGGRGKMYLPAAV